MIPQAHLNPKLARLAIAALASSTLGFASAASPWQPPAVDILIFAPHSDDEALGCAGVMLQALEKKQRVAVVVITAGDAHVGAAAAVAGSKQEKLGPEDFLKLASLRQQHSL